jgi:nucleoside-diphosphate-sugar epimerase
MKVFITGGTGFVGQNLVKHFKDHEVYEFKRYYDLGAKLDYFKPDLIINSAAEIYDKDKMWASNVLMVKECLDHVMLRPNCQLIQIGSSSEYGPVNRATVETDPVQPLDLYATTKGAASTLCQGYAKAYNLDVVVARPYSLYGPGERPHRLFPNLWKAFTKGTRMELVFGVHDFCYIDDFITGLDAVRTSALREPGEIVNISNGVQISNSEVLTTFQKIIGHQGNVDLINKFVTYPIWQCDNTKMREKFHWAPKYSFEQGVKKFLEEAKYE